MNATASLKEYTAKRDLKLSGEPEVSSIEEFGDELFFVVQKHDASSLHYDVRLRVGETMPSRAVPKGPSMDTSIKRLAIKTEDHPLAYADFEGVIPPGQYGAGSVMVWDRGSYTPKKEMSLAEMLDEGQLEVTLEGERLTGSFAFVRINDEKDQRLLIKMDDEHANPADRSLNQFDRSVLTDRTMEQIVADADG